jgi:hypothetical protein
LTSFELEIHAWRACSGVLSAVGLGSVSDTLVHNLHCPTVVVKPPAHKPADEAACAATAVQSAAP